MYKVKEMENTKTLPRNCTECEYTKSCMSYYGGLACEYEKQISQNAIARFWAFIEKNLK